jgi:hypothetical protein
MRSCTHQRVIACHLTLMEGVFLVTDDFRLIQGRRIVAVDLVAMDLARDAPGGQRGLQPTREARDAFDAGL